MKGITSTLVIILLSHFAVGQVLSDTITQVDNLEISKVPPTTMTASEIMYLDSFNLMVQVYWEMENKIIAKLLDDCVGRELKTRIMNKYIENYSNTFDEKMELLSHLSKRDYLLIGGYVKNGTEIRAYTALSNPLLINSLAEYLIQNNSLSDCSFFDELNISEYKKDYRVKMIEEVKADKRKLNIARFAKLLQHHKNQLSKIVADDNQNVCYRANAKLILEALEKNR